MNREFLESLGLEKETIDKVMAEHGKTVNSTKQEVDTLTTQCDNLQSQLDDRDKDLKELKKQANDNKELQQKYEDLEEKYEDEKKLYESTLKEERLNSAIKLSVADKAHDADMVLGQINKEKLVIGEDGKVVGLDEQIESLKESKSFLFKSEKQDGNGPQIVSGGNPNGGSDTTKSIDQMSYQELTDLKANNPAKFAELTK